MKDDIHAVLKRFLSRRRKAHLRFLLSFAYAGQASNACVDALSPSSSEGSAQSGGSTQSTPESGLRPTRQPVSPTSEVGLIVNSDTFVNLENALEGSKDDIDDKLFLYQTPAYQWIPSSVYKYADFIESLYIMATQGVAGRKFYIGEDGDDGHIYGLVSKIGIVIALEGCSSY